MENIGGMQTVCEQDNCQGLENWMVGKCPCGLVVIGEDNVACSTKQSL